MLSPVISYKFQHILPHASGLLPAQRKCYPTLLPFPPSPPSHALSCSYKKSRSAFACGAAEGILRIRSQRVLERVLLAILLASPLPYKKRPLAKPRLLLCGHRFKGAQQSSGRVDSTALVQAGFYCLNRLSRLNAVLRSSGPSFAGLCSRHFALLWLFFFTVPVLPLPALRRHACPPVSPGFSPGRRFCVLGTNATGNGSFGPPPAAR